MWFCDLTFSNDVKACDMIIGRLGMFGAELESFGDSEEAWHYVFL